MKRLFVALVFLLLVFVGCYTKPNDASNNLIEIKADSVAGVPMDTLAISDNSENALDWDGVYEGTLPCVDCTGIATELILSKDKSYVLKMSHQGKKASPTHVDKGFFSWDSTGSVIALNHPEGQSYTYKVGENYLMQLDSKGNAIEGKLASNYILKKKL